ncbi:phragmoplastin interacting protein 1 isoform X2 [Rhodamnia argentea]|uniref:Phragmoplastin interacting protein 1 isoform X2 n=1 Tax=Rhodamnia argentea TaxID=178133 RepID=A0ABM3HFF3_9MYRT|nr:phragmoplastin interacting protein 1 isoform X2 [Rhodamnia argentea]
MVLSNKKLKQKLKAALAESLAKNESNSDLNHAKPTNPDQDSQPQSLKQLLGSAIRRPRLSKREKRRKSRSLGGGVDSGEKEDEGVEERREKSSLFEEVGNGGDERKEEKRKKKRKKDWGTENGSLSAEQGGAGVSVKEAKKKKKEKKRDEGTENGSLGAEEGGGDVSVKEAKKKKKEKKRDEGTENGSLGAEEGGDVSVEEVKKKKEKKKKKKKKKSKGAKKKEKGEDKIEEDKAVVEHVRAEANSQESGDVARKVYVGGIPYYSSEDDIRSYFESCGTITEIDCMTFPESGKFRGIAIIGFKTEAAAKRALALDGSDMGGLFLKIQPYKANRATKTSEFTPPIVEGYNRIYIGNLSWDITEDDVRKFFSDCSISSIRFGMDKETGEFRGYAHVDFSDSLSMAMAIKLNQQVLCGRPVKIMSAIPKEGVKSSARTVAANTMVDNTSTIVDNTAAESTVSSGKMKRRTCYLCGEKGHISSACSKKPADASTNPDAT